MKRSLRSGFAFAAVLLAGCNGDLVIHEISPKTIVLVDAMPHEQFEAAQRCFSGGIFSVTSLGDDAGMTVEVMAHVQARLEQDGYVVKVEPFSEQLDVKGYPFKYEASPGQQYATRWSPAFAAWLAELQRRNQAGAIVILKTYVNSLYNQYGPYYGGYGARVSTDCIGIPPSAGSFYANVGVDVFTASEPMRKYFSKGRTGQCDLPVPDSIIEAVKQKSLTAKDLLPYREQMIRLGAATAEDELRQANVLHGAAENCSAK